MKITINYVYKIFLNFKKLYDIIMLRCKTIINKEII